MNIEVSQIITQILGFLVMLWILKKFGWKPILNILEDRKNKIKSEFDFIEDEKTKLHDLKDNYHRKLQNIDTEARIKIQEGIKEGRKIGQEIQEDAQKKARDIISKAKDETTREIEKVKSILKKDIINIALATAEKMIRENINPETQRKLVADFVEKAELK